MAPELLMIVMGGHKHDGTKEADETRTCESDGPDTGGKSGNAGNGAGCCDAPVCRGSGCGGCLRRRRR